MPHLDMSVYSLRLTLSPVLQSPSVKCQKLKSVSMYSRQDCELLNMPWLPNLAIPFPFFWNSKAAHLLPFPWAGNQQPLENGKDGGTWGLFDIPNSRHCCKIQGTSKSMTQEVSFLIFDITKKNCWQRFKFLLAFQSQSRKIITET